MSTFRSFFQPTPLPDTFFGRAYADLAGQPVDETSEPPAEDQGANTAASVPLHQVTDDVLSDAPPEVYAPGDRVVKNLFPNDVKREEPPSSGVTFHAYEGPPAGGTEHARQGPGGAYHFHLKNASDEEGPRISAENFKPLTPNDARLFMGEYKKAIESLTPAERTYIYDATRDIFHDGEISDHTKNRFKMRTIMRRFKVPFALPQEED